MYAISRDYFDLVTMLPLVVGHFRWCQPSNRFLALQGLNLLHDGLNPQRTHDPCRPHHSPRCAFGGSHLREVFPCMPPALVSVRSGASRQWWNLSRSRPHNLGAPCFNSELDVALYWMLQSAVLSNPLDPTSQIRHQSSSRNNWLDVFAVVDQSLPFRHTNVLCFSHAKVTLT